MKLRRKKNGAAAAKPANKDASSGPKASPAKKGGRGAAPARPPARRPARAPGRARRKIDPDRQIKYAQLLGLVFIGAGFVAIGVGWAGMARTAAPDAQLPYIVSGGAAGLGLIVFGVTLLILAQIRTERRKFFGTLEELLAGVPAARLTPMPVTPATEGGAANGHVIAGRTSFHRTDCRLVRGKPGLEQVTLEEAQMAGLTPCRVCSPVGQDRPGAKVTVGVPPTSKGEHEAAKPDEVPEPSDETPKLDETPETDEPTIVLGEPAAVSAEEEFPGSGS